jgi:hypothetical protein
MSLAFISVRVLRSSLWASTWGLQNFDVLCVVIGFDSVANFTDSWSMWRSSSSRRLRFVWVGNLWEGGYVVVHFSVASL